MSEPRISGTNILSDNWLLQVVAEFLSGKSEPDDKWNWIATTENHTLIGAIEAGVFQLDCTINLLEQIIFTDRISLMQEWIPNWYNHNTDLNKLFKEENGNFINAISRQALEISEEREYWLKHLLWNETIKDKFDKGQLEFENGEFENGKHLFWSQVINGAAEYLALADKLKLTYSPHSARAGFLKSTLWNTNDNQIKVTAGTRRFHQIVNKSRIRLSEILGYNSTLTSLNLRIPSSAMLCIAESSSTLSPIDVALQIRNNTEIKNLRLILHELTTSINRDSLGYSDAIKEANEKIQLLESIILKVEKELSDVRKIEKDNIPSKIDLDYFHCKKHENTKIITGNSKNEHSGIISKLLLTSGSRTNDIIRDKLKINSPKITQQFSMWHSQNFFNDMIEKKSMNLFKIKMENNYTNYGKVFGNFGPEGEINNLTINEADVDINTLNDELSKLLVKLKEGAKTEEQKGEYAIVEKASTAAKKGKKGKALKTLKKTGKWVFETATSIGVRLVAAILKDNV